MRVGVLKEIKPYENRVAMTPAGVATLVKAGHQVLVEQGAGRGSGFDDADFRGAGAAIAPDAAAVFEQSELIMKVKEPLPAEYDSFRPGAAPLYLSAPGAGAGVDPGSAPPAGDRHRL